MRIERTAVRDIMHIVCNNPTGHPRREEQEHRDDVAHEVLRGRGRRDFGGDAEALDHFGRALDGVAARRRGAGADVVNHSDGGRRLGMTTRARW